VQPWASCLHACESVTKQYNLVPSRWMVMLGGWGGNRHGGK